MATKRASRLPKNPLPSPEPEEEPLEEDPGEEEEEEKEQGEEQEEEDPEEKEEVEEEKEESGEGGEVQVESDYPPSPSVSGFTMKPITPRRPPRKHSEHAKKRPSKTKKHDNKDLRSRKKAKSDKEEERKDKSSSAGPSSLAVGRVWCEEDEITVLQGLIDYKKEKGEHRPSNMVTFHESIKGKLFADISRTQLYDKVRNLKKKFFASNEKNENGQQLVCSKLHDYKTFDLSRRIWGNVKYTEKEDPARDDLEADTRDFLSKYPNLSESFYRESSSFLLANGVKSCLEEKWSSIGSAKAEELEMKWKKVREEEAKIFLKKMDLIAEQTKLLLDASKNRKQ